MTNPKPIREQIEDARIQEFVSVEQLALILNISPKTVRRHLHEFPWVIRTKRLIRIHRLQAIKAWKQAVSNI